MRFTALDSWRGICALLVAMYHIQLLGHYDDLAVAKGSFLFVDFFFVLSGFVMTQAYSGRLRTRMDLEAFTLRRFGRLWPLHAAVILAYLATSLLKLFMIRNFHLATKFEPFTGEESLSGLVTSTLLVHSMGLMPSLSWNGPSWSISAEFWAYMVFASALMLLKPKSFVKGAALIAAAAAAVLIARSDTLMNTTFRLGLARGICGFFTGVIVHDIFRRQHPRHLKYATAWELVAVLAVGAFVAHSYNNAWSYAAPLVFAGAVLVFAYGQGKISSVLNKPPFQALGAWSYSVYMVHGFIILQANIISGQIDKVLKARVAAGTYTALHQLLANRYVLDLLTTAFLVVIVATASQTYRWIEEPARLFFNGVAKRYTAKRAVPVALPEQA